MDVQTESSDRPENRFGESQSGDGGAGEPSVSLSKKAGRALSESGKYTGGLIVDGVKSILSRQKVWAEETLKDLGDTVRAMDRKLAEKDQRTASHYAGRTAENLEKMSAYLRERNMDELAAEAEDLVRRHRALFVGGTFVAGFLFARLTRRSR